MSTESFRNQLRPVNEAKARRRLIEDNRTRQYERDGYKVLDSAGYPGERGYGPFERDFDDDSGGYAVDRALMGCPDPEPNRNRHGQTRRAGTSPNISYDEQ